MKKGKIIFKVLILALVLLGIWIFIRFVLGGPEDSWICQNGEWVKQGNPSEPKPTTVCDENNQPVGERDEFGCVGSAGYSWCPFLEKCIQPSEEKCPDAL